MKERPILMSGESVRAILDGRKTQTRRVVSWQPEPGAWPGGLQYGVDGPGTCRKIDADYPDGPEDMIRCPYGSPGDRLWVRETWGHYQRGDATPVRGQPYDPEVVYRADDPDPDIPHDFLWEPFWWRPSIHMSKKLARIWLEVLDVRAERLQEISEEDCEAEGVFNASGLHLADCHYVIYHPDQPCHCGDNSPAEEFASLWDSLNAKRGYSWESNPWVWVVGFSVP